MKTAIAILAIQLVIGSTVEGIRPDTSATPLFQVIRLIQTAPDSYDSGPTGQPTHHWTGDEKHPLLTVNTLKDFLLEADKKSVRVLLMPSDAKKMGDIIEKEKVFAIQAGDAVTIGFPSKYDGSLTLQGPIAEYLRLRFHVKPNSNDFEDAPTKSAAHSP